MPFSTADPWLADRLALTQRPESSRVVMHQRWEHLLFLHWEIEPAAIARLLPAGLEVDLFDGRAYVGLVPFTMRGVRPRGLPSVPGLSNFHETNVRTYVRTPEGQPGVWFFSLDAANLIATLVARVWFHLPYYHAAMTLAAHPGPADATELTFTSRRLWPRSARAATTQVEAVVTGSAAPAVAGSLEFFLAERYLLYTVGSGGKLMAGRVHHSSYPLQPARVVTLAESAVEAVGINRPDQPPIAHYARQVVVEVFGLEPVPTHDPRPAQT